MSSANHRRGDDIGRPRVAVVGAEVVRPLRATVLRAGRPLEASVMVGDEHPQTRHVAVYLDDAVMAVGSAMPEAPPWDPQRSGSWRIRGMATEEASRGRGLGTLVLGALIQHVSDARGTLVWCSARLGATALYERAGLVPRGETFVSEGVEHRHMWRDLGATGPGSAYASPT